MLVMFVALGKSFHMFDVKLLLPDVLRLSAATVGIVAFAALAVYAFPEPASGARMIATVRVGVAGVAALVAAYPALYLTGAITGPEMRSILHVFRRGSVVAITE
jgi:hypothetical protein